MRARTASPNPPSEWETDLRALQVAVAEFERALPGWWWSVGACSISAHASCGPDMNGADKHLLPQKVGDDRTFDEGFHRDAAQPAQVAESLLDVMRQGLAARGRHAGLESP